MSDNIMNNNPQPPVDCDSWCRIRNGAEMKFKFVFTIEKFSQRPEKNTESLEGVV